MRFDSGAKLICLFCHRRVIRQVAPPSYTTFRSLCLSKQKSEKKTNNGSTYRAECETRKVSRNADDSTSDSNDGSVKGFRRMSRDGRCSECSGSKAAAADSTGPF